MGLRLNKEAFHSIDSSGQDTGEHLGCAAAQSYRVIEGGGQDTGKHGRIVGERGRKGNAVFVPVWEKRDRPRRKNAGDRQFTKR